MIDGVKTYTEEILIGLETCNDTGVIIRAEYMPAKKITKKRSKRDTESDECPICDGGKYHTLEKEKYLRQMRKKEIERMRNIRGMTRHMHDARRRLKMLEKGTAPYKTARALVKNDAFIIRLDELENKSRQSEIRRLESIKGNTR